MNEATWRVVIANNGWIFVGRVSREGDHFAIRDGAIVRRFSLKTYDGIGGLAKRGPGDKDNDILDLLPTTRVHVLACVGSVECNEEAWSTWHDKVTGAATSKKAGQS